MLSKNTFTKFTKFTKFLLLSCSSSMTPPVQVPTPTSLCLYLQRPPFYPLLPRTSSSSSYYHQSPLLFYFSSFMLTLLLRHHRLCLQSELQPTPTTTTHPRLCRDPTPRHPHPQLQLLLSYYYYQAARYPVQYFYILLLVYVVIHHSPVPPTSPPVPQSPHLLHLSDQQPPTQFYTVQSSPTSLLLCGTLPYFPTTLQNYTLFPTTLPGCVSSNGPQAGEETYSRPPLDRFPPSPPDVTLIHSLQRR